MARASRKFFSFSADVLVYNAAEIQTQQRQPPETPAQALAAGLLQHPAHHQENALGRILELIKTLQKRNADAIPQPALEAAASHLTSAKMRVSCSKLKTPCIIQRANLPLSSKRRDIFLGNSTVNRNQIARPARRLGVGGTARLRNHRSSVRYPFRYSNAFILPPS